MNRQPVDYRADDYHLTRHSELIESTDLRDAWSSYAKREYFGGLDKRSRVLEFGGALGYNLVALASSHECHMLELSEIGRSYAAKYGIITHADNAELVGEQFDQILCRHVLEHVDHPLATLEFLRSLLKDRGTLVIVLPFENPELAPTDVDIDHHLYCWNPRTIGNLLVKSGLKPTSWRYGYFNGRRLFLPLYKLFGPSTYYFFMKMLGRLRRSKELIVEAMPNQ
jgi:SAM-dependent methyltransferase